MLFGFVRFHFLFVLLLKLASWGGIICMVMLYWVDISADLTYQLEPAYGAPDFLYTWSQKYRRLMMLLFSCQVASLLLKIDVLFHWLLWRLKPSPECQTGSPLYNISPVILHIFLLLVDVCIFLFLKFWTRSSQSSDN